MRISDWSSDVCSSDLLQDDVAGAWAPLATLVRLSTLDGLQCDDHACHLTGSDLYLLAAVATTADFAGAVEVPDGFTGSGIAVPRPTDGRIFLRLRDDPTATATVPIR